MITYSATGKMPASEKVESLKELIEDAEAYLDDPAVPALEKEAARQMKSEAQKGLLALRMEMIENGDIA